MKTRINLPLFLLLCALCAGCGSLPKTAYKTAAAADMTVSAAHVVFSDLVAQGKVPTGTVELANKALATYKAAEFALLDAAEAYQKNGDKVTLDKAIAALTASQSDFMAIVKLYTEKKGTP